MHPHHILCMAYGDIALVYQYRPSLIMDKKDQSWTANHDRLQDKISSAVNLAVYIRVYIHEQSSVHVTYAFKLFNRT
jgi:hypothetical protein